MSILRAKNAFQAALSKVDEKKDPVMHSLILGLLEFAKGLTDETAALKRQIEQLRQ